MPRRPAVRALRRLGLLVVALLVVALLVAGCGSGADSGADSSARDTSSATGAAALSGSLTVSAAASLTGAFTVIRDEFVSAHPDTQVTINFGSSGTLSSQLRDGAPADVAAFADTIPMDALDRAGLLAAPPAVFARNRLVIVTKPGNPAGIDGPADLATAGVISLCVETAPCGRFAARLLAEAGVTIPEGGITRGADAKATLTAVSEGDAVAGIVYVTDAASAPDRVDAVQVPEARDLVADYPIAVLAGSGEPELAEAFTAYVRSERGRRVLRDAGFLAP